MARNQRILTQSDASVFVQSEPGKPAQYLGECIDLDSIPNPKGGVEFGYCRKRDGTFKQISRKKSPPDSISFNLTEMLASAASVLQQMGSCPFTVYALYRTCGQAGVFSNWQTGAIVMNCEATDDTISNVAHHVDSNEVTHEVAISAPAPRYDVRSLASSRKTTAETLALNAISPYGSQHCGTDCGEQVENCERWVAVADGGAGSANVLASTDFGNTWTATAADPFAIGESIMAVVAFEESMGVNRILTVRNGAAAAPLEIGYSDDNGATWTNVNVGSTNNEAGTGPKCLVALDREHIWLGTDLGNVYFSSDGGATWTLQSSAVTASGGNDVNAISFVDEYVGYAACDADTIIYTSDGGANWSTGTATGCGGALDAVYAFTANRVIVGSAVAGDSLYISFNGAASWEERVYPNGATHTVKDFDFIGTIGLMLTAVGGVGHIYQTIDGGASWREITAPANSGLNAVRMCGMNSAMGVGEANGGTAVIVQVSG